MGTQRPDLPVSPSVMPVGPRGTGQRPVVIDLCCGLGGWSKAFLSEGWDAIGFDIERHEYGDKRYPGELILKSILEVNGHELRHAVNPALIVASPPCQEFSYMAMPFSRGKKIAKALRGEGEFPEGYTGSRTIAELTALYRACFRIARECGVPIVLENVKGAQPWVGRAQANFGSYYLWGDIANVGGRVVRPDRIAFGCASVKAAGRVQKVNPDGTEHGLGSWFAVADSKERGASALKQPGRNFHFPEKYGIPSPSFHDGEHEESVKNALALKNAGNGSWFGIGSPGQKETNGNPVNRADECGTKVSGDWFGSYAEQKAAGEISPGRLHGKNSPARKAASAMIAKIPFDLAQHIARVFKP